MPLGWSIFKKDNLEHLIIVLKEDYKINMDWEGTQCLMPTIRQEQGSPATSKPNEKKISWQVVGVLLGSGQLIQPSTLFNSPAAAQAKPTVYTMEHGTNQVAPQVCSNQPGCHPNFQKEQRHGPHSSASYLTSLPFEDAQAKTSSAPLTLVTHPKMAPYPVLNIS